VHIFSVFLLVEGVYLCSGCGEGVLSLLLGILHHGGRRVRQESNVVLVGLGSSSVTKGTSEHILVLLLGEVDIIVSVRMGVLNWVVSVILPGRI